MMKELLKFLGGWLFAYLFVALICLLANLKTMDYADCLANEGVQITTFLFGWILGIVVASKTENNE